MSEFNPIKFLNFEDVLYYFENPPTDWTTVSIMRYEGKDALFLFSVLIDNTEENKQKILSSDNWEVSVDISTPSFYKDGESIKYNEGIAIGDDIVLTPFTMYMESYGKYPSTVDILQNFIFYHNLRKNNEGNYVEPHDSNVVIRYGADDLIQIQTKYLRDYLAAINAILIQYFDHVRRLPNPITEIQTEERIETKLSKSNYVSSLVVTRDIDPFSKGSISILNGKNLIFPYDKPFHPDYLYFTGEDEKKYAEFVIGIDAQGKPIEKKCNEEKGLTLCYFDKKVLKKFYDAPDDYTIEYSTVYRIGIWYLSFGINREGLIHTWLDKLQFLPYEDQLHWKQYNVLPRGRMSTNFFKSQLEAKFVDTDDPAEKIKQLYNDTNAKFESELGFKLFKELSGEDKYVFKTTHILLSDEQSEFDQQISNLAKIFVDCLNKTEIENRTNWKHSNPDENRSINYLEHFLTEKSLSKQNVTNVIQGLRLIQRIRSESTAHTKSSTYKSDIAKLLGLESFNYLTVHSQILKILYCVLLAINLSLE